MDHATLSRRVAPASHRRHDGHRRHALGWAEVAQAMERRMPAAQADGDAKLSFLSAAEAADIEAVAAQIIPTDDSPGAREAGVVYFIDRALATFLLAARRRLSRAARRVPGGVSRTASGRRLVRVAHVRAADRVSERGRPDAVLQHDAAAHAPRHVLAARVRRQSRRRRLEAPRVRGCPRLRAAVRLLRSRLSRLRHRPGEDANECADLSRLRHRRLRHRRIRRGRRRDCAGAGAGRAHGRACWNRDRGSRCEASGTTS